MFLPETLPEGSGTAARRPSRDCSFGVHLHRNTCRAVSRRLVASQGPLVPF